jgi:superfamily I DNA/RNA helicase
MQLTPEQQEIISSSANKIIINAFAGTGKTSTLVAYSKIFPADKMLYLAYNKTMQIEARKKFPSNVDCLTVHGMAFKTHGKLYKNKLNKTRMQTYIEHYDQPLSIIKTSLELLHGWFYSPFKTIEDAVECFINKSSRMTYQSNINLILETTKRIWNDMLDINNITINMEHDGYLKLFQLDPVTIKIYKHILLDEAQDSNPITIDIFRNKISANRKIIVGDVHQAIYQFRGTTNALQSLQSYSDATYYITKSFRFGPNIAHIANKVLQQIKLEPRMITGNSDIRDVVLYFKDYKTAVKHTKNKSNYAVLARSNFSLFEIAFMHLAKEKEYLPIFAGGIERYDLSILEDLIKISKGMRPTQGFLAKFSNIRSVMAYAEESGESELSGFCRLINQFGATKVEDNINNIKLIERSHSHERTVILTTAHRSKGLEYDCVVLYNDFNALSDMIEKMDCSDEKDINVADLAQEANLLYVALTRAQVKLIIIQSNIFDWLNKFNNQH